MDSFTEVSSQGWLSRLGGSIKGVLVGLVALVIAVPLLFWNEGRAVKTAKGLEEGAGAVVSVPGDAVAPGNEGKLVHVSGEATTQDTVRDPELGVAAPGLALQRSVEMYQWVQDEKTERRKKLGGGEERVTTYRYEQRWDDDWHDPSRFKERAGHDNPRMPLSTQRFQAAKVTLGAFTLTSDLVDDIDRSEPLPIDPREVSPPATLASRGVHGASSGVYFGANPSTPAVGDVRVSYSVVKPQQVSVVARQTGASFSPYVTTVGTEVQLLEEGVVSAQAMFQHAQDANAMMTWILRAVGFFVMFVGFAMVFKPLSVVADVVPFVGSLVGLGTGLLAFGLALVGSSITVGFAWVFYRPLIGVPLLVGGVGLIAFMVVKGSAAARAARA